ncbi:MAG: natural resistance-associated macrophage protein metal ion transporter NRAMP, partial [Bacteroidetes bacterium]
MEEVHGSVDTTGMKGGWRKLLAFLGPAYLVSVGYMDPGNWATDIAGGSQFGYALLWVLLMSNLMALLLQSLSARLGLVAGLDLAQASKTWFPRKVNYGLWFLAEIAIAATDLAEIIGMAIGMQLLFGLPLLVGVSITVLDTFLILFLQRYGIRKMEAFIIGIIGIIGMAFVAELFFSKPAGGDILKGLIPSLPGSGNTSLYIAIGIIGATVMPHNLYLHSSLVQTRKVDRSIKGLLQAIKYNIIDSVIALNLALFVNSAILILAAAAFYDRGIFNVAGIQDAHHLLGNVLGDSLAPALFAIALIAAGQSSTLTGTLSGQIVMEGHLNLRIQPWLRRLITRMIAIIPAVLTLVLAGEEKMESLLVLSQVVLSLQLGFAVIPLIHFTSNKKMMGELAIKWKTKTLAWLCALIIVGLNVKLVAGMLVGWIEESPDPLIIWLTAVPVAIGAGIFLLYVTLQPFFAGPANQKRTEPHEIPELPAHFEAGESSAYEKVAVCVDFSTTDHIALSHAFKQGGKSATYLLIHIVETAGARVSGNETDDYETSFDKKALDKYAADLRNKGFR